MKIKQLQTKTHSLYALCLAVLLCFLTSCSSKVDYYEASGRDVSVEKITEEIGAEADEKVEKDGMLTYTYEKCSYMDYVGEIKYYYFDENTLAMQRWQCDFDEKKEMQDAYKEISNQLTKDYGEGTESDDKTFLTWTTDKKQVIVGYDTTEKYSVYVLENMNS